MLVLRWYLIGCDIRKALGDVSPIWYCQDFSYDKTRRSINLVRVAIVLGCRKGPQQIFPLQQEISPMRSFQQGELCNQMLTVEHGWHPLGGTTEAKTSNKNGHVSTGGVPRPGIRIILFNDDQKVLASRATLCSLTQYRSRSHLGLMPDEALVGAQEAYFEASGDRLRVRSSSSAEAHGQDTERTKFHKSRASAFWLTKNFERIWCSLGF